MCPAAGDSGAGIHPPGREPGRGAPGPGAGLNLRRGAARPQPNDQYFTATSFDIRSMDHVTKFMSPLLQESAR